MSGPSPWPTGSGHLRPPPWPSRPFGPAGSPCGRLHPPSPARVDLAELLLRPGDGLVHRQLIDHVLREYVGNDVEVERLLGRGGWKLEKLAGKRLLDGRVWPAHARRHHVRQRHSNARAS